MVLEGAEIKLGSASASDFVALASEVLARLNTIRTTYNSHTHLDPVSGQTAVPTQQLGTINSVAASKVKAE